MDARDCDILAARSRDGDPRALAVLYREFAPPLLGYLQRLVADRAEAEDLLHETFLRIFEGRGRYSGRGRFREWLFTIATRLARDRLRQSRRRSELTHLFSESLAPGAPPDPSYEIVLEALQSRVDGALADFPPSYAEAFDLRVRNGFTYHEMAAICDEPEATLRSRVHRALEHIRRVIERDTGATSKNAHPSGREREDIR